MSRISRLAICLGFACALIALPARAVLTVYSSRVSFGAALGGGLSVENWEGFPDGTVFANGTGANGITYNSSTGSTVVTNVFTASTTPNTIGRTPLAFFLASDTETFTFTTPITAFAIDINTFDTADGGYQAALDIGGVVPSFYDPFPAFTTGQFIGFTSDTPFLSLTISAVSGFTYNLDTLQFLPAPAAAVPEPVTAGLSLLALAALGGWASRRPTA